MQSFLKEADKRQAEDERVLRWILEIRDLAYDVEDVVETFALKVSPKRRAGCANSIKRATCIFKEACELHRIKSQIEEITKRINESTRRVQTYGIKQLGDDQITSSSRERRREERRSYPHLVQENVIGFDSQIEKLVSVLMADEGEESRAVSIYGMGGIGKTTLAKKVYSNHQLKGRFDCFAWVYVSQQCEKKNVWAAILSSLDPTFSLRGMDLRFIDPQELAKRLFDFLKDKRYLVVLDDVWSTQDCDGLSPGFPMDGYGGKFLVTSRYRDVALHIHPRVYVHEMECLDAEDSWELFCKISLPRRRSEDFVIHKKLEELGKRIVECCKGLPLAISVIGGILATKDYTYHDWKMVHDTVRSYFREAKDITVHDSLSLSYEDLPSYLKPCFLYLAHFPEDFEIPVQRLIQMWIAEGFISAAVLVEGRIAEDIAESYLIELLDRCIIQVGKRNANMRIDTCRLHDLMRDFCLAKAKEESFLYVIDHSHDDQGHMNILQTVASRNYGARRLALHKSGVFNFMGTPNLRTLMFLTGFLYEDPEHLPKGSLMQKAYAYFNKDTEMMNFKEFLMAMVFCTMFLWNIQRYISHIFNCFRKLRVLHIKNDEDALFCNELKNVGSLMHLRYFCLEGDIVCKFPSSLGKLSCLLTLDLRINDGKPIIPDVIWRMEQLRHLHFPKNFRCKSKLRLRELRNLLTLTNFSTIYCHLGDIPFLTKLRELTMCGFTDYADDFNRCVAERCCHFCLVVVDEGNLNIGLEEDPMPMLGELPNLRVLVIEAGAFSVEEMKCSAGSFPSLDSLTLDFLDKLVELKIAEGAMSDLYHLKIKNCQQLKRLPTGFKSTKALKKVEIEKMPKDFDNWWRN